MMKYAYLELFVCDTPHSTDLLDEVNQAGNLTHVCVVDLVAHLRIKHFIGLVELLGHRRSLRQNIC